MAIVFIALGIPVYAWARKENYAKLSVFTKHEKCLASTIVLISLIAIYCFVRGIINI